MRTNYYNFSEHELDHLQKAKPQQNKHDMSTYQTDIEVIKEITSYGLNNDLRSFEKLSRTEIT